jgi:hypothetical protein
MKWNKERRDKMSADDFVEPQHRLWPIEDEDDLAYAAAHVGFATEPTVAKKRLAAIAARKGLKVPQQLTATFSVEDDNNYCPSLDGAAAEFAEEAGDVVKRICPVAFKSATYDFKDGSTYDMSPEEIKIACKNFRPVKIDDNHLSTAILKNGKPAQQSYWMSKGGFGEVTAMIPNEDYSKFGLELHVNKWVDQMHRDEEGRPEPIPISCTFSHGTKQLAAVAMTPNPRITEAAMFAAFAAEEEAPAEKPAKKAAPAMKSPSHQKLAQFLHDHTAMAGAVCNGDNARTPTAQFASESEMTSLQKMHDESVTMGAGCNLYKENLAKNRVSSDGVSEAMNRIPAFRSYHPEHMAMMSADEAAPPHAPTAEETRLKDMLDRERAKSRKSALAAVGAETAAFSAEIGSRLPPNAKNKAIDLYRALASDDVDHAALAEFSGETNGRPSRAYAVKALVAELADSPMTREMIADERVLFTQETTRTPDDEETDRLRASLEAKAAKNGKR